MKRAVVDWAWIPREAEIPQNLGLSASNGQMTDVEHASGRTRTSNVHLVQRLDDVTRSDVAMRNRPVDDIVD